MTERSPTPPDERPATPSFPSDATTPIGDTCRSTAVTGETTGTWDTRPVGDRSDDDHESLASLHHRWFQPTDKRRVGDPDHPINVEAIKEGMGCLPICEVWIEKPVLPFYRYTIRHRVPAHERTYSVWRWRNGQRVKLERKQDFHQEANYSYSIDPYFLDRYRGEAEDIAREIVRQLRYTWNDHWTYHA